MTNQDEQYQTLANKINELTLKHARNLVSDTSSRASKMQTYAELGIRTNEFELWATLNGYGDYVHRTLINIQQGTYREHWQSVQSDAEGFLGIFHCRSVRSDVPTDI